MKRDIILAAFIAMFAFTTGSFAQSGHSGSIQFALGDGSVRFVSSSVSQLGGAGKVHYSDMSGGGSSLGIHDSPETNTIKIETVFPATYNGGVRVSAADIPASTESECMATTDFSAAVPMRRNAYVILLDYETSSIQFSFGIERAFGSGCKVVRLNGDFNNNGTVDAADYVLWRKSGPLANDSVQRTTTVKLIRRAASQPETYYHLTMKHVFIS